MTYTAHLLTVSTEPGAHLVVRDEHGGAVTEIRLAATATPDEADTELRTAGWARHAAWSSAKDGWLALVVVAELSAQRPPDRTATGT